MEKWIIDGALVAAVIAGLIAVPVTAWAQAADEVEKSLDRKTPRIEKIDFSTSSYSTKTRLGLANSTGNTSSLNITGGNSTTLRYHRFENEWRLGGNYERVFSTTGSGGTGTQKRFIFGTYRLDYYNSEWTSLFVGGGGFSDYIKGIDLGARGFGGIRFFVVRRPKVHLSLSFGYDFTYEDRFPPNPDKKINSALQEVSYEQQFGGHVALSQRLQCLEDVQNGYETRVNSRTAVTFTIIKHLAVDIGFTLRFDNQPAAGKKKLDTLTDLSLAIQFGS